MWILQKLKTWVWPSIRFILVTAALREILRVLGVDLGKLWSTVMTTATDYQNTYGAITLIIFGLMLTYILEIYWPIIRGRTEGLFSASIPIALSEVKSQWFSNYAGFHEGNSPEDDQAWSFGDVQIANISDNKTVSLKIYLCINAKQGEPKFSLKLLADGLGGWGLKYQEQKTVSKGGSAWEIVPTGLPVPNIVRCPINLKPHDPPIEAKLVFITKWGDMLRERITLGAVNDRFAYSLLIEDHISGNEISFPIPGSYRGK